MIRPLDDWSSLDLEPAAARVGPFPRRPFLEVWWRCRRNGRLLLAEAGGSRLPLWEGAERVEIAGEEDLTDYHSTLGGDGAAAALIGEALAGSLAPGTRFRFDSLPSEVAAPMTEGLRAGGVTVDLGQHETTAIVDLPGDYDAYLAGLRAKDRHEIRRKGRRFEADLGFPRLVRHDGDEALGAFVAMHRSAPGAKGRFMTREMEPFFRGLLGLEGASLFTLAGASGRPVAAAVGFEDEDTFYLYNSAFDPSQAASSPGLVLVDRLIAEALAGGKTRFDFLKGDEVYKYRLGADARPLFVLEGTA